MPKHAAGQEPAQDVGGFSWEENYPRSWDAITEDDQGRLRADKRIFHKDAYWSNPFRKSLKGLVKRGMVRHLVIVLDASLYMAEKDWLPSRLDFLKSLLPPFILDYFDQNPISQLGFIYTKDGIAQVLSDMNGNAESHLHVLKAKNLEASGEPSLHNALVLAKTLLFSISGKASKEILFLFGGLSSCDPADIHATVESCRKDAIRISVLCLAAELYICSWMAKHTFGTFAVALNESHFRDCLMACTTPFPLLGSKVSTTKLLKMGFPKKIKSPEPSLCACHRTLTLSGYECPLCHSKLCYLPSDCVICGTTLVLSPHLAKSYHHLFPINDFVPLHQHPRKASSSLQALELALHEHRLGSFSCFACSFPLDANSQSLRDMVQAQALDDPTETFMICDKCDNAFCLDCDKFIHESIHACPGCVSVRPKT